MPGRIVVCACALSLFFGYGCATRERRIDPPEPSAARTTEPSPEDPENVEIVARRFVVVDEAGAERASLGLGADEAEVALLLRSRDGSKRVEVSARDHSSQIAVFGTNGRPRLRIHEEPLVDMISLTLYGGGGVDDREMISIYSIGDMKTRGIIFPESEGNDIGGLVSIGESQALQITSDSGAKIGLSFDENGEPVVSVTSSDGKTTFLVPKE